VQAAALVRGQEGGQPGQQPALGKDGHAAHQQARAVGALGHGFERVVLQAQQVARDLRVVAAAHVGEGGAAGAALHQLQAQLALQQAQLLAHGAVGEAQFFGGLAHAVVARHGVEDQEGAGAGDVFAHVRKTAGWAD